MCALDIQIDFTRLFIPLNNKIYNFSAGPAVLPAPVLERVRNELTDYNASGMSIMEVSHRGSDFMALAEKSEASLRELLNIPKNYVCLFLQGGATMQFSAVPLNLGFDADEKSGRSACVATYVDTGAWSVKAIKEAARYLQVHTAISTAEKQYTFAPPVEDWDVHEQSSYVHYTLNETIGGVEYHDVPSVGDIPLVTDASSTILSRPLNVSRFGLIYAGAQKNIGPAGLTIVIVREDLVGKAMAATPSMLDYAVQGKAGSMSNTPATFSWYIAGLVFDWIIETGGLVAMEKRNRAKAQVLYDAIDSSGGFYTNPVRHDSRSLMNVPFVLSDSNLDAAFLKESALAGLTNLKGHRSVGGMRASIYNAMPEEGVQALVEFMLDFQKRNG